MGRPTAETNGLADRFYIAVTFSLTSFIGYGKLAFEFWRPAGGERESTIQPVSQGSGSGSWTGRATGSSSASLYHQDHVGEGLQDQKGLGAKVDGL
jgi:hypothetical protein